MTDINTIQPPYSLSSTAIANTMLLLLPRSPLFPSSSSGMALCRKTTATSMLLLLLFSFLSLSASTQTHNNNKNNNNTFSFSFPLTSIRRSGRTTTPNFYSSFVSQTKQTNPRLQTSSSMPTYNYRSNFKYSMALIVPLPIGTPPQTQQMVLDTGSQLSWIQCHRKTPPKKPAPPPPSPSTSFDPSLSSSFSVLPCNHPLCKPRIPDYTLPTSCDQNRLCHYSYFYADGTYAEGNLVREKFSLSRSQVTPPLILGCAKEAVDEKGILGMNLGRLSFASQAKVSKFSYCVPTRQVRAGSTPTGSFYLGQNPNAAGFMYVNLLTFSPTQRSPNLDPLAYSVPLQGIRIGGKRLNIPVSAFRADASGSGQTIIDSGSELTYLVDEAYNKVREEVVRRVGPKLKRGYVYGGVSDMCFDSGNAVGIGRSIGDMVFEFEKGVEIVIEEERVLADVEGGVHCVAIGRSNILGAASNIIGNFHQQNLWVEYDLPNRRIGFGKADCSSRPYTTTA